MFVPLFPFPVPIPLIGEQLLPPNRPALPRHGLKVEGVPSATPGRKKTDSLTCLKVANRSGLEVETLSRGCGLPQGERSVPLGDSKGRSPWRFFGDFLIGEKVTRGGGAERPLTGECRGGVAPSHIVGRRGPRPCKKAPRGTAVPPLPIPQNEQKVAPQHATAGNKKARIFSSLFLLPNYSMLTKM